MYVLVLIKVGGEVGEGRFSNESAAEEAKALVAAATAAECAKGRPVPPQKMVEDLLAAEEEKLLQVGHRALAPSLHMTRVVTNYWSIIALSRYTHVADAVVSLDAFPGGTLCIHIVAILLFVLQIDKALRSTVSKTRPVDFMVRRRTADAQLMGCFRTVCWSPSASFDASCKNSG